MIYRVLLFYIIISPIISYSQSTPDNFLRLIQIHPEREQDSLYYEIYSYYKYDLPDSAKYYALKVNELAKKFHHNQMYIKSLHALGFIERDKANFSEALKFYQEGLRLSIETYYQIGILMMINDFGALYYYEQNYDSSLIYYLKEIEYAKKFNQAYDLAIAYNNLASINNCLDNYNDALENYLKCIEIKTKNKITDGIEMNYCNIALTYINLKEYDKAIKTFNEILNNSIKPDKRITSLCYYGIGKVNNKLHDFNNAIANFNTSLTYAKSSKDLMRLINNYTEIAQTFFELGDYKKSLYYLDSASAIALKSKSRQNLITIYNFYSMIYQREENYLKALSFKNKMVELRDSIFTPDQSSNIKNSLLSFQQSQNDILLQEKEWRIQRNRQFGYFISAVTFLLIIILFFSYRALILRRKLAEKLDELVDIKTLELSDSNEKLKRSHDDLDTFLYRTSHDIRGPIATLMGLTNVARINGPEKITGALLEKMDITTNKVNEIINRLTGVSLLNSMTTELTSFNLLTLVNDIVRDINSKSAIENGIQFKLSGNIPAEIKTDKVLLKIILFNLLENSFKFYDRRETDPMVELNINLNDQINFLILDNGIGIDPNISNRIFDFFFVASEKRGAGLGLYQARLATIKLGGTINLKSFKKPTSFQVVLPLA